MRFKASYTVEASYIVPLFTIIVAVLINLMVYYHDVIVFNSVKLKMNIKAEFTDENKSALENAAHNYLSVRLIYNQENKKIIDDTLVIKNNAPEFIRFTKAVKGEEENSDD